MTAILVSLITLYGWFLNIYYFFNSNVIYKGNPYIHVVGIFVPIIGAIHGYFNLYKNKGK